MQMQHILLVVDAVEPARFLLLSSSSRFYPVLTIRCLPVLFSASSYPCLRAPVPSLLLPQSLSIAGVARSQICRDETGVCVPEFAASFFLLSSDTVRYSIPAQSPCTR
ncbi:hypothetical protein CGRA01v4_12071 [Colletotrichum graminicola]|nr:hypothetical protein CGRA01v4_12071 [Colletotrichum graminicola]